MGSMLPHMTKPCNLVAMALVLVYLMIFSV
jgi:hypothetical protein